MVNGRRVEFRDMSELFQAESRIQAALVRPEGASRGGVRRFRFTTLRGD
jgi:hypothetical protein